MRRAWPWLALAAIVAGAAALLAIATTQVREWVVQTDEMLYIKLAEHTGSTGSPLPVLHGERVGFLGIVYPLVLAPFYGALGAVDAFTAAHAVNAVLFASAAIPAYLLARRLVPTAWALGVALLSLALPWSVNAAFVMSEAAAYAVFLWVLLACHAAIAEPSPRRDVLAAAALALAFLTRPQFLFLVVVLALAALIVSGRTVLREHRVLAILYAAGALVVIPLTALGEGDRLLGDYGVTATQGSILPLIAWKSAALHLDVLAVGLCVVPLLLGAGWAYSSLRLENRRRRAFAALTALALPVLALETASYDVRFGGTDIIRDRYLFYLAPMLLLATACCLRAPRLPLLGIGLATAFFAVTAAFADFAPVPGIWVDSPESVLNGVIHDLSPGLPAGVFVALVGLVLGGLCLALVRVPRAAGALAVGIVVFAFAGSAAGYAYHRLLTSNTPLGVPVTGQPRVRDWVDRAVDRPVALLAYPISRDWGQSAIAWWDVENFNNRVERAFTGPDGNWTYTPFPSTRLTLDFGRGTFAGTEDAPRFVLGAQNEARFGLVGSDEGANVGMTLRRVERPYRAAWATRGLSVDGWTRPGQVATIRVYAKPGREARETRVDVTLDAPPEAASPVHYVLGGRRGEIRPGARVTATATVCVPKNGHADLLLDADRSATVDGPPLGPAPGPPRAIGVAVSGVDTTAADRDC